MWITPPALIAQPSSAPTAKTELLQLLKTAPQAKDYPNSAKATLLDLAEILVRPDGSSRRVTRQTIKVLNARGREEESEIKIPYNGSYETVTVRHARTLRPDGTLLEVQPADIRQGASEGYDDAKILSFSMPGVEPGCVIDYEYVTEQKTSPLPGQFWFHWYFQGGLDPVQLTRLRVTLPKGMNLARQLRNSTIEPTLKNTADGKSVVYTWEQKNVAPLDIEPLMPPAERQLPKLSLSTVPGWQTVAQWYGKLAKDRMQPDAAVAAVAREVTRNCKTDLEKARALFYYVQEKTRPIAIELGISAYQPRPASRTLTAQYGDCKDMATLLVALLRSVGLSADPALLEASAPFPKQTELPSPELFDHAICRAEIGGKVYWLDATAQVCRFGDIPQSDCGAEALVVHDGRGTFETLPTAQPEQQRTDQKIALSLTPEGSATGVVQVGGNGDYEMDLRANLLVKSPDESKKYVEALLSPIGVNPKVESLALSDVADRDAPVTIQAQVRFPAWASVAGDLLIFKARVDQTSPAFASPFTEDSRLYPIYQSQPRQLRSTLEITLPDGYSVLYLPKDTQNESVLGSFSRTLRQEGRKLTVSFEVRDNQLTAPATEYKSLRQYIDQYLHTYNELVILKKTEP